MDAERGAQEVARSVRGCTTDDQWCELTAAIAAALLRAHAAGRREAVEECARVAEAMAESEEALRSEAGAQNDRRGAARYDTAAIVLRDAATGIRALAAGAGEKEREG